MTSDKRLAEGAVEGALRAVFRALSARSADAIAEVARPWDAPAIVERAPLVADLPLTLVDLDPVALTIVASVGDDGWRAQLRGVWGPEDGEWRLVRLVAPDEELPPIHPEWFGRVPLPPKAGWDGLRWLCLALEDLTEVLGTRVFTMPGRPMESFTEDVGSQGETRSVKRSSWIVGRDAEVVVEESEHEIFDGATPRWTVLWGLARGLEGGRAVMISSTIDVGSSARINTFLCAPRADIDRTVAWLLDSGVPGARALPPQG